MRALGEDLILFRDKHGRVGLLHARCCHRGTTLYYGKVEEDGIRCCYHGWKFDTEGHCLEQPCEPDGGQFRDKVRQPWYPVEERYGLIFGYMGPAEKRPVLPRYECLENMDDGEFVEADDSSIGGGGPAVIPCNWLQHFENVVDPYHVPVLHGSFSGPQFTDMMASMPEVKFDKTPRGITVRSIRKQDDDRVFYRVTEAALPSLRVVPNPRVAQFARVESIGWTLPIDDTSFRIYVAGRVKNSGKTPVGVWFDTSAAPVEFEAELHRRRLSSPDKGWTNDNNKDKLGTICRAPRSAPMPARSRGSPAWPAPCSVASSRRKSASATISGQPGPAQAFMKASMSAINRSLCVSGSGCGAPS